MKVLTFIFFWICICIVDKVVECRSGKALKGRLSQSNKLAIPVLEAEEEEAKVEEPEYTEKELPDIIREYEDVPRKPSGLIFRVHRHYTHWKLDVNQTTYTEMKSEKPFSVDSYITLAYSPVMDAVFFLSKEEPRFHFVVYKPLKGTGTKVVATPLEYDVDGSFDEVYEKMVPQIVDFQLKKHLFTFTVATDHGLKVIAYSPFLIQSTIVKSTGDVVYKSKYIQFLSEKFQESVMVHVTSTTQGHWFTFATPDNYVFCYLDLYSADRIWKRQLIPRHQCATAWHTPELKGKPIEPAHTLAKKISMYTMSHKKGSDYIKFFRYYMQKKIDIMIFETFKKDISFYHRIPEEFLILKEKK